MQEYDRLRGDVDAMQATFKDHSNFKVNPLNALGLHRDDARDTLYQFARRKPVEYSKWRQETIRTVIHTQAKDQYDFMFNFLARGLLSDKADDYLKIPNPDGSGGLIRFNPAIPEQEAAEVAADIAASTVKLMREQLNKIMPPDFETLANSKIKILTNATEGA